MRVLVAGAPEFAGSRLCPELPHAGIGTRTQPIAVAGAVPRALGEWAKSRRPA